MSRQEKPVPEAPAAALLTVPEVAKRLRVSGRKVYDFAARKGLAHTRAGGKMLFAAADIDAWLARAARGTGAGPASPTIAGSHDPLLDWAVRESRCGLALLTQGSRDGLERLARGEVCAALIHLPSADLSDFNREAAGQLLRGRNAALLEWARREQGLLVARGNPKKIRAIADLARRGVRVAARQPGAGSAELLDRLLAREGLSAKDLRLGTAVTSERDLAEAVRRGEADAGLGAKAAAGPGLAFVPLLVERLDLAVLRGAWFEKGLQSLFALVRSRSFAEEARQLGGYDVRGAGTVTWNDPG